MVDGYRVMFAYPGESPFANLKVEVSDPKEYVNDKDAIVAHLEASSHVPPPRKDFHGFDLRSADSGTINGGGTIGIYVLFKDETHTIVTIYFLNQRPESRHFKTRQEYADLRDSFLEGYVECLSAG
jgi:hypothetical protein